MQKDVFQCDVQGLYLYKSVANELAMTPGTFNIPFGAYEDAPPAPPTGKWPRRVGDAWVMVDDYRTTPLWVVDTAAQYSPGEMLARGDGEASYPGWGALPDWLTATEPSGTAEHTEN